MGRNVSSLASPSGGGPAFAEVSETTLNGQCASSPQLMAGWLPWLDASPCVTIVADLEGRVCFVNTEGRNVLGAAATEALLSGRALSEAFVEDCRKVIVEEGIPTALQSGVWHGEGALLSQQHSVTPVALSISARHPAGEWIVCVATDIAHQRMRERRLEYLATHDALTGLPNLNLFSDRLAHEVHTARRSNRPFAVLFLDIDRFKELNDDIGHERANRVLAELAVRLYACVRAIDTVARYGGDEFAMILTSLNDTAEVKAVVDRINAAMAQPFSVPGATVEISVSVGVALFPFDASDDESLVVEADRDMYRRKVRARRARGIAASERHLFREHPAAPTSLSHWR
jgi:diguanylate cyclase (GGDEF)-like protein